MSYQKMADLIKRQMEDQKDLAAGVYEAWKPIMNSERLLLSPYGGQYENAPSDIQERISRTREAYFQEWDSDGRLAALMAARHAKEREELAEELQGGRQSQKDRGR